MAKQRIVIDTSVPGAYYNREALARHRVTRQWWKHELPKFEVNVVEVTVSEIEDTREGQLRSRLRRLVSGISIIEESAESIALANTYLREGVIPKEFRNDARHIAAATLAGADYLVSWNFAHLVNEETRKAVEAISRARDLKAIRIVSPMELGGGKYEIQSV